MKAYENTSLISLRHRSQLTCHPHSWLEVTCPDLLSKNSVHRRGLEPRYSSGLNVTSSEISCRNVLIFDFCCISRCSRENSHDRGLSLSSLKHVIRSRLTRYTASYYGILLQIMPYLHAFIFQLPIISHRSFSRIYWQMESCSPDRTREL